MSKGTESIVLTSDGQVSPANQPGWLKSYVVFSKNAAHSDISFEDGSGGAEKWADSVISTTVAGDKIARHTFSGRGLFFPSSIYLNLTNTPKVCCEYEKA